MLFNGPEYPQNCPLPLEDLNTHLIHGSLGPPKSLTQIVSWSVQLFLQSSQTWPTEIGTQTYRHTMLLCLLADGIMPCRCAPGLGSWTTSLCLLLFSHFCFMSLIRCPATTVCRQLYIALWPSHPRNELTALQTCLTSLQTWFYTNSIALNPDKSSAISARHGTAPTVWNYLPSTLRSSQTLNTFRKHLKIHLYQSAFNSP